MTDKTMPVAPVDAVVGGALIPVPNGMSAGFYAFMGGVGASYDDTGQLMMLATRCGIPKRIIDGNGAAYSSAKLDLEQFQSR